MSFDSAWEVTEDDLMVVLNAHKVEYDGQRLAAIMDMLDTDEIICGLLNLTDFDEQCDSMYEDIELQLIENNILPEHVGRQFEMSRK